MKVGEARNILFNSMRYFDEVKTMMRECEHNLPQYHKQPGTFKEIVARINSLCGTIDLVIQELKFTEKEKPERRRYCCSDEEYHDDDLRKDTERDDD
jgi:hypothetical protein